MRTRIRPLPRLLAAVGFTLVEVAISVAILAGVTAVTAFYVTRNTQPTVQKAQRYATETSSVWDGVSGYQLTCPEGVQPSDTVRCTPAG